MIFRRKKQTAEPADPPAMRGRDSVATGENPLARRFRTQDEPDTIDLQQPAGFNHEPGTADLAARPSGNRKSARDYPGGRNRKNLRPAGKG